MPLDRFAIRPFETGLQTYEKPFAIPDDAFSLLINAYVFRGRVRKRFGSVLITEPNQYLSRLRIRLGNTDPFGAFGPFIVPGAIFKVGQMFTVGSGPNIVVFTVISLGGAFNALIVAGGGPFPAGVYNTTTGSVTLQAGLLFGNLPVYFYPAEPVTGFANYENAQINNEPSIAYDTQFAYQYMGATLGWQFMPGGDLFTGNFNLVWSFNARGATSNINLLFATTGIAANGMAYWDGALWHTFGPLATNIGGNTIITARLIVFFKDRLLLFNTIETVAAVQTSFINRVRFSQNGSPLAANAFYETPAGLGGYIDAPTTEEIVTVGFLKDRLIVFFENSTWELVYTRNEILPFVWQKINTELGIQGTFSLVPFDKVLVAIGNVGIHACNGANVERIDQKIPDNVFNILASNYFVNGICGIRDFYNEMIYWAIPYNGLNVLYNNNVLIYNYRTGSWGFAYDSITALGYYEQQPTLDWAAAVVQWQNAIFAWNAPDLQVNFRQVLAGNQEGYTFIIRADEPTNAYALQITNIDDDAGNTRITVIDHNFYVGDFVQLTNIQGTAGMPDALNNNIYQIITVTAVNIGGVLHNTTITLQVPFPGGVYAGGGQIRPVSRINILTKQYNFYLDKGVNFTVQKVDFLVDAEELALGALNPPGVSINVMPSSTGLIVDTQLLETAPYPLVTLEQEAEFLWHTVYLSAEGEFVQLRITLTDAQMLDPNISLRDFQMHAMIFHAQPTSYRLS